MNRENEVVFFSSLLFQKYRPVATEADHAAHPSAAPGKCERRHSLQDILLGLQRKQDFFSFFFFLFYYHCYLLFYFLFSFIIVQCFLHLFLFLSSPPISSLLSFSSLLLLSMHHLLNLFLLPFSAPLSPPLPKSSSHPFSSCFSPPFLFLHLFFFSSFFLLLHFLLFFNHLLFFSSFFFPSLFLLHYYLLLFINYHLLIN